MRLANGLNRDDTGIDALTWMMHRNKHGVAWGDMERAVRNYAEQVKIHLANGLPRPIALRNFFGQHFRGNVYLDPHWTIEHGPNRPEETPYEAALRSGAIDCNDPDEDEARALLELS